MRPTNPITAILPPALAGHGRDVVSMDRIIAWLHEPAKRLHGMILDVPGLDALHHVSLSVYDPLHDMLWAFPCRADSGGGPEVNEIEMTDALSLTLLADGKSPRIVDDLAEYGQEGRCHTEGARASASRSSMTVPLHSDGSFLGFVMFGAMRPHFFTAPVLDALANFTEAFGILVERARNLSD